MNKLESAYRCCVCNAGAGDVVKQSTGSGPEAETTKKVDQLMKCSQCHVPVYCSKECQKEDWKKRHKTVCLSLKEVEAQIQSEATQWKGEKPICMEMPKISTQDELLLRPEWWGRIARASRSPGLTQELEKFFPAAVEGKMAVDLGCGYSSSSLYLLTKGWKVIAVDYSKTALEIVTLIVYQQNSQYLETQKFIPVCEKIETFQMPAEVDLVMANSSLMYCDPKKIHGIMTAIFRSLKPGGLFVGNFFAISHIHPQRREVEREMGAWFLKNEAQTAALLTGHGFVVKKCEHGRKINPHSSVFIAEKPA